MPYITPSHPIPISIHHSQGNAPAHFLSPILVQLLSTT
jgi:hypothetical protein